MLKRAHLISLIGFGFGGLIAVLVWYGYETYQHIFRLSEDTAERYLKDIEATCTSIASCELLPGDFLIRKYTTARTRYIEWWTNPYFTHSAVYLGNDMIAEAVGNEKNKEDEIQLTKLSTSDWTDRGMDSLIVVRPKLSSEELTHMLDNIRTIAHDPDYEFGIPKEGKKRTTCSHLMYAELVKFGVLPKISHSEMVSPDYLFFLTHDNVAFEQIKVSSKN